MRNSVPYPILRRMLGCTNDEQVHQKCQLMTLGIQVRLLISWHEHVKWCYEVHAYVTQWSTSLLKCTQMTLAIRMLKNIFLLPPKMYPNVLLYMS